jgi:hypothetical protein
MTDNPDWVFYRDDKATEAEIMPRLVEEFPGFRSRWEKHLELWKGEPAGGYNDISQFAHFVVEDSIPVAKPKRFNVCSTSWNSGSSMGIRRCAT